MITPDQSRVELLTNEKFDLYWPRIAQELNTVPHIWNERWTIESIQELTLEGRFQCWAAGNENEINSIMFSQISNYPATRVLQIFLAFGTGMLDSLDVLHAACERFAVFHGCEFIEVVGRPGWEPKLRTLNFEKKGVVLSKMVHQTKVN